MNIWGIDGAIDESMSWIDGITGVGLDKGEGINWLDKLVELDRSWIRKSAKIEWIYNGVTWG